MKRFKIASQSFEQSLSQIWSSSRSAVYNEKYLSMMKKHDNFGLLNDIFYFFITLANLKHNLNAYIRKNISKHIELSKT